MKTINEKSVIAPIFLVILGILVTACKDNVLIPVNDTHAADSTLISIANLDSQNVKINLKENKIRIQIAAIQNAINNLSDSLDNAPYNPRKIQYTVYLVNAGSSLSMTNVERTQAVNGATVTLFSAGKTITTNTVDGRAIFEGLDGGNATVQILANGFTPVTYQTYFFTDNRSSFGDGAVRVASTNILIFPTSGKDVVTITGQLFANKSTLDDTLGRQYSNSGDASLYLKYISPPGNSDFYNYTQNIDHDFSPYYNYYYNNLNSYGVFPNNTTVKYDPLLSLNGANIYGYPNQISDHYVNDFDPNVPGKVLNIIYSELISQATVDNTGKYTLLIPSWADFPGVNLSVEHYTDDHTFLTSQNNVGSTLVTIKNFDPVTYVTTPVDFYKITSKWIYRGNLTQDDGSQAGIYQELDYYEFGLHYQGYNVTSADYRGKPGTTVTRNIFFYATVPAIN